MEIRQVRNWLLRDQLTYWQSQIKRGQERVSMARAELYRRKLSQSNSDAVSDTEQNEAVRDAQRQAARGRGEGDHHQEVGPRSSSTRSPSTTASLSRWATGSRGLSSRP